MTGTLAAQRRARVVDAMGDAGVDALLLGREANARYVSGARRLWLAGTRPFGPGCVLTLDGEVHLMNASDDGVPPEVPFEHLYALTWNPANLMARLARIPQLAAARRIGVDALTPMMASLLGSTFPNADLVDGAALMLAARRVKLPDEIDALRRAVALATDAFESVVPLVRPGGRERELKAAFERRMCELGTTTPAFEGTFGSRFPGDAALSSGDRVALDVGVLVDGYEGGLGRTVVCSDGPVIAEGTPADDRFAEVVAAMRPGAPRPAGVDGVGLGVEPLPDTLVAGTTLSLRVDVDDWLRRDLVLVTDTGAEILTPRSGLG